MVVKQIESEVDSLPDREFQNLTRSTIPLLCYWREDRHTKVSQICQQLGLPDREMTSNFAVEVAAILDARASETDLMLTAPQLAIAVEAKWSEPRYETVETWRKRTSRWRPALEHWLQHLKPFADAPSPDEMDHLVYQMIHRCASACATAGALGTAVLLYQVFEDAKHDTSFYATDLRELISALKPKANLLVALQTVQIRKTLEYTRVGKSLLADAQAKARVIREAIKQRVLFDFDESRLVRFC
jgi:uncharacterized protein DUF6946